MGRPLLQLCARPQVPEKTQPASWKNPVDSTNSGAGRQPGTAAIHDQVAPLRCCTETTLKRVTTKNLSRMKWYALEVMSQPSVLYQLN